MKAECIHELARAILATVARHEASWQDNPRQDRLSRFATAGRYTLTWDQAAEQAIDDEALRPLVVAMLAAGYCDFVNWANANKGDDA